MRANAVAVVALLLAPVTLAAQTARAEIRGTVSGGGHPLPATRLYRTGSADTTRTDSLGHYSIFVGRGNYVFEVVHSGFSPIEMELNITADTAITVDIPLEPAPGSEKLERVGFNQRRERGQASHSGATFWDGSDIAATGATRVTQLFEHVQDITLQTQRGIRYLMGSSGQCSINIWIDGSPMQNTGTPNVDGMLTISQIAGMEIYTRYAQVPVQFQRGSATVQSTRNSFETRSADCGAVVVWTTSSTGP